MSTMHPTGDGGGGPTSTTSTDDNVSSVTPLTGMAVLSGSHHHQHPPPSPLSGCYLLVVLPEPHTAQHRDLILNRLAKGFLSWDKDSCHVDLEKELQALVAQAPEGEEARNGERLIQYATENLVTEVLIHPQANTLLQCVRNLLASFTKHRHIIHAGYTFSGNGSWILQDGTFSLADFLDAFSEHEVQRVLRAYENSVTVDINCAGVGEWSTARLSKEACTRSCRVRLNPDDVLTAGVPAITSFTSYVGQYLVSQTLDQLMEPSDVVGNIRFSHPTLYVFPGGQGDAALFGINGFNMLVDGGFARKACFWDFARHLDRLDAVLITRINNSNVGGMSSVLRKKREMQVYPQIGHFFCNLIERKHSNSPDGDKDLDPLILNLTDIGQEMMVDLRHINLRAHPCYRDRNPINLYHKVGHGTLDMYVLSPSKDSREVREFLTKWHASDSKLFTGSYRKDSNNLTFPIQNLASICALLVWQPANPEDTITRILFPGSTPQHKIFEGIERLKHLEFLKHPVCTAKSLSPSTSISTLKDRSTVKQKLGLIEETKKPSDIKKDKRDWPESKLSKGAEELGSKTTSQATPIIPMPKAQPAKVDVKAKKVIDNKKIETESKKNEKDLKDIKKESIKKDVSKIETDSEIRKLEGYRIKMDNEKTTLTKEHKVKSESKRKDIKESKPVKVNKTEPASKPIAKILDKKPKSLSEKKDAVKPSPPTPKKSMHTSASKIELARTTPRPITKPPSKQPPSTMPAKSAKDANNRKVVEQKNIEIASAVSAAVPATAKVPAKQRVPERKPIGRRPKPVSPKKAHVPISPTKSTRSTPTTSVKSDKDGVVRKVRVDRGTTDSSTVSTPSGIEIDPKLADKSLTEKSEDMSLDSIESKVLADLKEERDVVEEIEAVLQKAERIEGARGDDHLDGDDDVTAEATDKKEEDMTEDDVTADIEELPKKEISRKTSHELTEEDEYLIIEKEEIFIEDSIQSGEGEQKNLLDVVESETAKTMKDECTTKEEEEGESEVEAELSDGKEKTDVPEKKLSLDEDHHKEMESDKISPGQQGILTEPMKNIITSAVELVQKVEDKDDSGKKDSEDITKEPSSLSPDKFESSEKKTTETDIKQGVDQKDQQVPEKLEESHEKISTLESGATTTAPTLPEDERIPLDEIKEVMDEKYMADPDHDKIRAAQANEPTIAQIAAESMPEVKPFEVRPPLHGVQREIVKTPDEVADLPVHEEVDPKLYQIEDFEKAKEERPTQVTVPQQETREPETPLVKEQKGVFSFFGKVADKFEKGIDKLTGKSRRDSEKDIDEKSSSKSGSPKEMKSHNIPFPDDVGVEQITPVLAKIGQKPEVGEAFEKGKSEISKIKMAAIKETATFLQDEIEDLHKTSYSGKEWKESEDPLHAFSHKSETNVGTEDVGVVEPVFRENTLTDDKDQMESATKELEVEEDAEEVEALLEEASKKFKTVKDSLRDSLESLEEKIAEDEMVHVELATVTKDIVKDTLCEVVEKLEDIKPHDEDDNLETKELEKVKSDVPQAKDVENECHEDVPIVTKDFKEAVRDVGEVLAGSAGILIEDKPKDVTEIVKKVAEVLKKDDFLSDDILFDGDASKAEEKTTNDEAISKRLMIEEMLLPKKVGITEELPPQEEIGEMLEGRTSTSPMNYKIAGDHEILEDPCVQTAEAKGAAVRSPVSDPAVDSTASMRICDDLIQGASASLKQIQSVFEDQTKLDVMEAGIEAPCIEQKLKDPVSGGAVEDNDMDKPIIVFDRKVSPVTAEIVIITPDFSPTSPKFLTDKIQSKEIEAVPAITDTSLELPTDLQNALHSDAPLPEIIENFVFTGKKKITSTIIEYITVIRKIPREKIIYIIEELIIKKGVTRESVFADLDLLQPDVVSTQKRGEIVRYIDEEYIMKKKKITMKILEQISLEKLFDKRLIIEIIEGIIIKKNIPREMILDISEKEFSELVSDPKDHVAEKSEKVQTFQISGTEDTRETISPMVAQYSEIEKWFIDEIITAEKKITPDVINDICVKKHVPKWTFVKIIEELILKRNIPRSSVLEISEKELSELLDSEKEHDDIGEVIVEPEKQGHFIDETDLVMTEKSLEIGKCISDEFITKNRKITPQILKDISAQHNVSKRKIIYIIEEIVLKHKIRRSSLLDVSDNELEELLAVETEEIGKVSTGTASEEEPLVVDDNTMKSSLPERSEIENTIVEEFIMKRKRITPYIFEDICVRYKVPRRIIIEIIEEIVLKRNIARNTILDITDTELSELLTVMEAEDEEEDAINVTSIAKVNFLRDDAGEDKLDDGFVSIEPSDKVSTKNVHVMESTEHALKESDKDVVDDFEAVEQEYKIRGVPIEPEKELLRDVHTGKSDEEVDGDIEEAIEDDINEVVEATEKATEIEPTVVAAVNTENKSKDIGGASEIIHNVDKTPERSNLSPDKDASETSSEMRSAPLELGTPKDSELSNNSQKVKEDIEIKESAEDSPTHDGFKIETNLAEIKLAAAEVARTGEMTAAPGIIDSGTVTDVRRPTTMELNEEYRKSEEEESKQDSSITVDTIENLRVKRESHEVIEHPKDSMAIEVLSEAGTKPEQSSPKDINLLTDIGITDATILPSGTVRRMVVTASSEDGGQETEVCPTGSIIVTPDDSLKSSPVKTTPDQDSLRLEKESLHSGTSTPEKDSISDKSTTGTKDDNKITPEDSLDKSLLGHRDSQDFEDSLDKSDRAKLKEAETEKPVIDLENKIATSIDLPTNIVATALLSEEPELSKKSIVEAERPNSTADGSIKEKQVLDQTKLVGSVEDGVKEFAEASQESSGHIDEPKSQKHSNEYDSKDRDDRASSPNVSSDVVNNQGDYNLKSFSPTSTSDEDMSKMAKSPSAEYIGSSASKPSSSHLKTYTEQAECDIPISRSSDDTNVAKSQPSSPTSKEDEKESDHKSRSPSLVSEKDDGVEKRSKVESTDDDKTLQKSRSPSIDDGEHAEIDGTRFKIPTSATVTDGKHIEQEQLDGLVSPSSHSEQQHESLSKEAVGISRSSSSVSDKERTANVEISKSLDDHDSGDRNTNLDDDFDVKNDEGELIDRPALNVIATDARDETESSDHCSDLPATESINKVDEKQGEKDPIDRSKYCSIVEDHDIRNDIEELEKCKSPSIYGGNDKDKESLDRPTTSSIADEEELQAELTDHSKTSAAEKQNEVELINNALSQSIALEKEDEKELFDRSRSTSFDIAKQEEKASVEHIKSPEIRAEELDDKEIIIRPRLPSLALEKSGEKGPIDHSQPSSTSAEEHDEKESIDLSKLPGLTSGEQHETERVDRSTLSSIAIVQQDGNELVDGSSIANEKQDEKQLTGAPRSPIIAAEKEGEMESTDLSRSPNVAGEKENENETIDGSKSSSVIVDKQDKHEPADHPRSSSVTNENEDRKVLIDRPRSPKMAAEEPHRTQPIESPKRSSITADEQDQKESFGHSRSPSVSAEKQDEEALIESSRSPSIINDTQNEKELIECSQSPSTADEDQDKKEPIGRSQTSSTAAEDQDEKESIDSSRPLDIVSEKQHVANQIEGFRSPSISNEKLNDEEPAERSRPLSVTAEQQDDKEKTVDRSRSPSIAAEKEGNQELDTAPRPPSIVTEQHAKKESIDRPDASSIAVEKQEEQEVTTRSKSSSITSEKLDEKEPIDRSRSPSIATEKQDRKESDNQSVSSSTGAEKQDEAEFNDRSKSPSLTSGTGKQDESQKIDRSRSPSIACEEQDDKIPLTHSSSSISTAGEQGKEEPMDHSQPLNIYVEQQDEKELIDRSEASSIDAEKPAETEQINGYMSSSIATENQDEKIPIDSSKLPGITDEKQTEADKIKGFRSRSTSNEKLSDEEPADRSKLPSVSAEQQDDKDEPLDRSRSSSTTTEKHSNQELDIAPRPPSTATEQHAEKELFDGPKTSIIVVEKQEEHEMINRSKSSSISDGKLDEKEPIDRSRSPSIANETQDRKESDSQSVTSSIVAEKQDGAESNDRSKSPSLVTETGKQDESQEIDRSISPSIASEKQDDKMPLAHTRSSITTAGVQGEEEPIDHSRPLNVGEERQDEKELIDRAKASSLDAEKPSGTEQINRLISSSIATENQDEKQPIDSSSLPGIADEKQTEAEQTKDFKSLSTSNEKLDHEEPADRSQPPSVAAEQQDDADELMDRLKSPNAALKEPTIVTEQHAVKEPIDRPDASSIAVEKQEELEVITRSKSSSITSEKLDKKEPIERPDASSIAVEKQEELEVITRSKSSSITSEKLDKKEPIDRSRSPSIATEKQDRKESDNESVSSSITSEKLDKKEPIDRSRSPSIATEKQDRKESDNESVSSSITSEKLDKKEPIDRSRSPSIATEKQDRKESDNESVSSSIGAEKQDEAEFNNRSKSPSLTSGTGKPDEIQQPDRSRSVSISAEEQNDETPLAHARSPSGTAEKQEPEEPIDHSRPLSIGVEERNKNELIGGSTTSSIDAKQLPDTQQINRLMLSTSAVENQDEKEPVDGSTSLGIADEKQNEAEQIEGFRSPSISNDKLNDQEPADRSKPLGVIAEQQDDKEKTMDRSRSPSVAAEKQGNQELGTAPSSSTIDTEQHAEKEPIDRSDASSIAVEKPEEQIVIGRSRSSSSTDKDLDDEEPIERSRSPSIATEKQDRKEPDNQSVSSSIVVEKQNEAEPYNRSKSPSLTTGTGKHDESQEIDRSRSPSIASEEQADKMPLAHSRSPISTAGEQDKEKPIEHSRPFSVGIEQQNEKADRSPTSSIVVEKPVETEQVNRLRSLSIAAENQEEKEPIDRPRSFGIADKKQHEPGQIDDSKSPSISSERLNDEEPAGHSRPSSVTAEQQDDEEDTMDRSRSPNAAGEKEDNQELDTAPRSPGIAVEQHAGKGPIDQPKASSIAVDKQEEQEMINSSRSSSSADGKLNEKESIDRSRSPSIAAEKQGAAETNKCSKSPSLMAETGKQDEMQQIDCSRSPSVSADEKDNEISRAHVGSPSSTAENQDEEEPIDHSQPLIVGVKQQHEKELIDGSTKSNIDAEEPTKTEKIDRSMLSSIATENQIEKESVETSRPDSITVEAQGETDPLPRSPSIDAKQQNGEERIDQLRSPTVSTGEESFNRSRSPSITSDKRNEYEPISPPRLSTISDEKHENKLSLGSFGVPADKHPKVDGTEQIDMYKLPGDESRSPTTVSDNLTSTAVHSTTLREELGTPATYSEKIDDKDLDGEIRAPSEAGDGSDDSARSDLAKLPSIAKDEPSEYGTEKPPAISRPTSATSETLVEKKLLDPSRSSSIEEYEQLSKDESSTKCKSHSTTSEKHDEPIDLSKTSTTADDKMRDDDKSRTTRADSPSGVDEHSFVGQKDSVPSTEIIHDRLLDQRDAVQALQKLADTIADKSSGTKCDSEVVLDETAQQNTPKDRSRSHSLFEADEKTPLGRSRTTSLFEDKVPEVTTTSQLEANYFCNEYEQATITKNDVPMKPSTEYVPQNQMKLANDSETLSASKLEGTSSERSYMAIEEDIARQFAEDYHTTTDAIARVDEYIVNKYIMKKEKITSRTVDEIVTLYSMPRNMILELIEAVIVKKNVPRDSIINYSEDDEKNMSAVVSEGDHVDMIDILPAKRLDIKTYIDEKLLTNNIKISWKVIDELAALKSISRQNIIMIIEEMIIERKLPRTEVIEDGILDESKLDVLQSAAKEEKCHESEVIMSPQLTLSDDSRIEEDNLPSMSTNFKSKPDSVIETDSTISEQKRVEVESYVMEECVKKGRKITLLVLEQIIARMAVPRPVLLDIIENIIVTRKMSRMGMVDDAIYDDVKLATRKSPEHLSTKDRVVELSGKSTPDLKSSGYSTPEIRQYEDKFGKEMSSYSTDYESPFHKAFVGGMTEIRTTHITTFSGKSTPDYSVRGETPESLPDSVTSSTYAKSDEKYVDDKCISPPHTSGPISIESLDQAASIFTTPVTVTTSTTKVSTTIASAIAHSGISVPSSSDSSGEIFADDHDVLREDVTKFQIQDQLNNIPSMTQIMSDKVYDEEKSQLVTKIIRTEIVTEEEPIIETKVIQKKIIEQPPEIITDIIRRSTASQDDTTADHYTLRTISKSSEEQSPEVVEMITVRTTTSILTEGLPYCDSSKIQAMPETIVSTSESMDVPKDYSAKGLVSADIKKTVTTVTTLSELDEKISTDKNTQKTTDVVIDPEILGKVMDDSSMTTEDIGRDAITESMGKRKTDNAITEDAKTITLAPNVLTPEAQTVCYSEMTTTHSASGDEQSAGLGATCSERIILEKLEHPKSSIPEDLISEQRSYSGETSRSTSLPKDVQAGDTAVKLTPDISHFVRESATGHPHISDRSTPEKRPTSRSATATPEGLRSNEVIRTTITTTRTMSEEGDIITTTMEITETTNEKGETTILEEKTDVKVEDRILPTDVGKGAFKSGLDCINVPTDLPSETDADPMSPRSDHSSLHSRAGTHVWGSSEERHMYSDEEVPGSPLSTTSQVGYSPQSTYHFGEHSFGKDSSHKNVEFSEADMSSSFCGELPDVPHRVTTLKTAYSESSSSAPGRCSPPEDSEFTFKKLTVEKDLASVSTSDESSGKKYVDDADPDSENALTEHKEMKGDKQPSSAATAGHQNGNSPEKGPRADAKKDPLAGWGTPLGLPSPKPPKKFNLRIVTRSNNSTDVSPDLTNLDAVNDWGEPLRLPSPAAFTDEASNKGAPSTPKKERKQPKKVIAENIKNGKRSESPSKNEKKTKDLKNKINPVYVDLTYVPHHGNSYYTSVEFFKRIRARYYVFSGTEPSREVYDALLDAKKTWEDKDLEVTMIPTYDTDTLGYWVADNEEALAANHIDLSPSASRCTINLQDHETSCSAYRLEF